MTEAQRNHLQAGRLSYSTCVLIPPYKELPEGMGVIMRTEATGKRARHIVRDLSILVEQWNDIVQKRDSNNAPASANA